MSRKMVFTVVFGLVAVAFAGYGIMNARSVPNESGYYVDKPVEGDLDKFGFDCKPSMLDKERDWLAKPNDLGGGLP